MSTFVHSYTCFFRLGLLSLLCALIITEDPSKMTSEFMTQHSCFYIYFDFLLQTSTVSHDIIFLISLFSRDVSREMGKNCVSYNFALAFDSGSFAY